MTAQARTQTGSDPRVAAWESARKALPGAGTFVEALRAAAIRRFAETGFPTAKDEAWKGTDVRPVAEAPWRPAPAPGAVDAAALAPYRFGEDAHEAVFVDGHHAPELSRGAPLPKGVRVASLATLLDKEPGALEGLLGSVAKDETPFAALNTAFFPDGAYVEIPRGATVEKPIHLLFVRTDAGTVASPRALVVARESAQATVVETHVSLGRAPGLTNAVTEIVAEANAHVQHVKVQRESEAARHVALTRALQGRDSDVHTVVLALGGALFRSDVDHVLDAPGANAELDGLFVEHGAQHMDFRTRIDHAKPHCTSRELYKGILDGKSRGVFEGTIFVRKDAQKTDAKQTNKNLLLSNDALVDSNPQLEIFADDVKCTHGSTIGQLDPDALFYLRARGIDADVAKGMLTYAFAREVTERVRFPALRERVDALVLERLPAGDTIRRSLA